MNSLDAGASEVEVDLKISQSQEVLIRDNGCGMTLRDLEKSFLSMGSSGKFGDQSKYGRIGIGSLALLRYGETAVVETKAAGSPYVVHAQITNAWSLSRDERSALLDEVEAGTAVEVPYVGDLNDHFTVIRLQNVDESVQRTCNDVSQLFALVERLRLVLPLPWPQPMCERLIANADDHVWAVIFEHVNRFSGRVVVKSRWGADVLDRRLYGEAAGEQWTGAPHVFLREIEVHGGRRFSATGFLLSQSKALPRWAGITARVQNVAVEERTFFDVEADPGFRKYLTGEVYFIGDVDRERLVNIDRASFNRECVDYQTSQRYLADEIVRFKSQRVQQPRRAKVKVRQRAEDLRDILVSLSSAAASANVLCQSMGIPRIPSSGFRIPSKVNELTFESLLVEVGATMDVDPSQGPTEIRVNVGSDGTTPHVTIGSWLANPVVHLGADDFTLRVIDGGDAMPPVAIRSRPRAVILNFTHHAIERDAGKAKLAAALEIAYLVSPIATADALYDTILEVMAAPDK